VTFDGVHLNASMRHLASIACRVTNGAANVDFLCVMNDVLVHYCRPKVVSMLSYALALLLCFILLWHCYFALFCFVRN
jgi:hypothetical protein